LYTNDLFNFSFIVIQCVSSQVCAGFNFGFSAIAQYDFSIVFLFFPANVSYKKLNAGLFKAKRTQPVTGTSTLWAACIVSLSTPSIFASSFGRFIILSFVFCETLAACAASPFNLFITIQASLW